ncbi:MAG: PRC-barrel domain-containing protein [Candidatus Micrarchaeota archaeon]
MTFHVSRMYGLSIYDTDGEFLGKAYDLILNMETGEVVRITTEPLRSMNASKEELTRTLQKKSILYKRVRSVKDIIVVGK